MLIESNQKRLMNVVIYDLLFILACVLIYHSFFWNKYLAIQDGWGNTYAALIRQGKIPYRDFYFFTQPVTLMISVFLDHLFGNTIAIIRIWGICERFIIGVLLYFIYRTITKRSTAIIASVVSLIFYTGTALDVIFEYVQTCFVFILLSTYLVLRFIKDFENNKPNNLYLLAAGFFGGLAFMTKQTIGFLTPIGIMLFLIIYEYNHSNRFILKSSGNYIAGFMIPCVLSLLILNHLNALHEYIHQVFLAAPDSKGGLGNVLLGSIVRHSDMIIWALPIAVIIFASVLWDSNVLTTPQEEKKNKNAIFLPMFIFTTAMLITKFSTMIYMSKDSDRKYVVSKFFFIYITLDTFLILALYLLATIVTHKIKANHWKWLLLLIVSLCMMYSQSLSYAFSVSSLILALGLLIILLFSVDTTFNRLKNIFVSFLCIVLISVTAFQHCMWPYSWWGWISPPVKLSTKTTNLKPLAGIKMSSQTAAIFSNVTRIIQNNTEATDTIFVFPHMPIFYLLSNRYPSTFALVNYFDVCPDSCANEDASRLIKNPPKVIVVEEFSEFIWKIHEDLFRRGNLSGQRNIIGAINSLIQQHSYIKVASYPTTVVGYTINVWVRN